RFLEPYGACTDQSSVMAEKALYDNPAEPNFPFETVSEQLHWLAEDLSQHLTFHGDMRQRDIHACLMDTILVFGRARTSALHGIVYWDICSRLVSKLNTVHTFCGTHRHQLVLVQRGPRQFFITTAS